MFVLNPKDKTPIFTQIENQVIEFIALGILKENDQLPSVRFLANTLGINPNTVAKAYTSLENNGYVYTMSGKGVFVAENHLKDQMKKKKCDEFKKMIMECSKFGISKEELLIMIDEQWKGEESC